MTSQALNQITHKTIRAIADHQPELALSIYEVGALSPLGEQERFYCLPDYFPHATVTAFEVDPELCEKLNKQAAHGIHYYPSALGCRTEQRTFYETTHPMCSSLYRPDEKLLGYYNYLEMAQLKGTTTLDTISMDQFVAAQNIAPPDFIKIDIQGAELEVFQGGQQALQQTLLVVSEVEFIPMYEDQPLFGDVCAELAKSGLMFHSFLGLAGRAIRPVMANNDPNRPSQQMWADAIFMTHITRIEHLASDQLLKLSVLALLYDVFDVVAHALKVYDERHQTTLRNVLFS